MTKILIDRAVVEQALEALDAMMAEFRSLDLPYGSKAYALAKDARLDLRKVLAEQPAESLDGKLVMGLAVIRELTGTQKTDNIEATIEAVRKAVAQIAEPFGEFRYGNAQGDKRIASAIAALKQRLAEQPAEQEPLTDDEIAEIVDRHTTDDHGYDIWCDGKGVARAVERAHGIGGQK